MRLIDADALYDKAEAWYKNAPTPYRKIYRSFIDIIADAPTIDPPPNDPLTLAELREMGLDPVPALDLCKIGICSVHVNETKNYGQTWIVCRIKQKETVNG